MSNIIRDCLFGHRYAAVAVLLPLNFLLTSPAEAAIVTRDVLKSFYETGDIPTEAQFSDLIDSFINPIDDGLILNGSAPDPLGQGALLGEGTEVGPGLVFTNVAGLGENWVGASGFLGLSLQLNSQTHYGYLQITAAADDQYPMFVEYVVYESVANMPIQAIQVPEPSSVTLLGFGGLLVTVMLARGRRRLRRSTIPLSQ